MASCHRYPVLRKATKGTLNPLHPQTSRHVMCGCPEVPHIKKRPALGQVAPKLTTSCMVLSWAVPTLAARACSASRFSSTSAAMACWYLDLEAISCATRHTQGTLHCCLIGTCQESKHQGLGIEWGHPGGCSKGMWPFGILGCTGSPVQPLWGNDSFMLCACEVQDSSPITSIPRHYAEPRHSRGWQKYLSPPHLQHLGPIHCASPTHAQPSQAGVSWAEALLAPTQP